jgi:hypothetical protein
MSAFLILGIVIVVLLVIVLMRRGGAGAQRTRLEDARAESQRWYERLGGQLTNLHGSSEPAVQQALADAGERYNAAGGQLQSANSVRQFELARESALEGLQYVRAARMAMGIDPGPELPALASQAGTGQLTREREVTVEGQHYKAGPQPGAETPYYYPGGRVQGRPVPAGWYSTPVWKTALGAGAGALGGLLLFDALFSPGFGDPGFGGYDNGYQDGFQDAAGDVNNGDMNGGDNAGDFGGGGGGGGDWGGGDFGGGDFGGGDF